MLQRLLLPLLTVFATVAFGACDLINEDEPVPAYIHVDSVQVTTDPFFQGSAAHGITDVWAYAGNDAIGVFEMPTTFPVLEWGETPITLLAGVKENGVSTTRAFYPFFTSLDTLLSLEAAATDTVIPHFTYRPNTGFLLVEGFEGVTSGFEAGFGSQYNITKTGSEELVFEGDSSLFIAFNDSLNDLLLETESAFALQRNVPVWMEMNFKTTLTVGIGFLAVSPNPATDPQLVNKVLLNPTDDEWRKIYINFTPDLTSFPEEYTFIFYIAATHENPSTEGRLYLDNIKLLTVE